MDTYIGVKTTDMDTDIGLNTTLVLDKYHIRYTLDTKPKSQLISTTFSLDINCTIIGFCFLRLVYDA